MILSCTEPYARRAETVFSLFLSMDDWFIVFNELLPVQTSRGCDPSACNRPPHQPCAQQQRSRALTRLCVVVHVPSPYHSHAPLKKISRWQDQADQHRVRTNEYYRLDLADATGDAHCLPANRDGG